MNKSIIAVVKPKGPTSHDVINKIRSVTGIKKVGHAGTLDPLASGILVVGLGKEGTRKLHCFAKSEKEYIAKIKLGETSTTDDAEGKRQLREVKKIPKLTQIKRVVKQFMGEIQQIPPTYSAIKIKGQVAYKRVRRGEDVRLQPRNVFIKDIKILDYNWPYLTLNVITGPGTYIRALARDIGESLGVGGYLADLERTRVGEFRKEEALALDKFASVWKNEENEAN